MTSIFSGNPTEGSASRATNFANNSCGVQKLKAYCMVLFNPLGTVFIGIALSSFGVLFFIGNTYLVRIFFKLTLMYLKFNFKLIKPEGEK